MKLFIMPKSPMRWRALPRYFPRNVVPEGCSLGSTQEGNPQEIIKVSSPGTPDSDILVQGGFWDNLALSFRSFRAIWDNELTVLEKKEQSAVILFKIRILNFFSIF